MNPKKPLVPVAILLLMLTVSGTVILSFAQTGDVDSPPTPTPEPPPPASVSIDWENLVLPEHHEEGFGPEMQIFTDPSFNVQLPQVVVPQPLPEQPAPQPQQQLNNTAGFTDYIVAPGDTIYGIARRFGIAVSSLLSANPLANPNLIHTGQILRVPNGGQETAPPPAAPTPPPESTAPENGRFYTVVSGDTLYQIARRFSVTLNALVQANQISNPSRIYPGMQLTIPDGSTTAPPAPLPEQPPQPAPEPPPQSPPPSSSEQTYVVRSGDSLVSIARQFGVSVEALAYHNNISNWARIYPGQTLKIPPADLVVPPPTQLPPSASGFIWPVDSRAIVQGYHGGHLAIDIVLPVNSNVLAIASGTVEFAGWNNHGYGNLLVLNHGDGRRSLYAHNSSFLVGAGQEVAQGQAIALSGNTGRSSMPHLHLEIMVDTFRYVNPCEHLPGGC